MPGAYTEPGAFSPGALREEAAAMHVTKGIPASEGFAVGAVRRLRHMQTGLGRAVSSPAARGRRLSRRRRGRQGPAGRAGRQGHRRRPRHLTAQRLMLDDQGLTDEILAYIGAGAGAAAAVERAAGIYPAGRMRALDDEYMRERACDILDACYRVVDVLDGQPRQDAAADKPRQHRLGGAVSHRHPHAGPQHAAGRDHQRGQRAPRTRPSWRARWASPPW